MSGIKGKSGRKKVISTIVSEAIDAVRQDLPLLFVKLKERALDGDREAAIYLIDRVLGKPKVQAEIESKGDINVSLLVALLELVHRESPKLIIEGEYDVLQRQGITEGSGKEGGSEAQGITY